MKTGWATAFGCMMCLVGLSASHATNVDFPDALEWAYPTPPKGVKELKLGPGRFRAPNGTYLTGDEIDAMDLKAKDWLPSQHPSAPAVIVGPSRRNGPAPCAECHGFSGGGLVNIPDLAGMPASYIAEQLRSFRSGERGSARPNRLAFRVMVQVARAATEADVRAAAAYFASTPRRARIRVVESEVAPATAVERFGWLYKAGSGTQRLDGHIVEFPQSVAGVFLYDPGTLQLAYVPKGSLARGAALVRSGGGSAQPCSQCHGTALRGLGAAPPLAGRDPSYLARALWDIRSGARHGASVALMQRPARGLNPAQISDVTAYLASLRP